MTPRPNFPSPNPCLVAGWPGGSRLRLGPRSGRKTSLGAFWGRFRVPRVSRDNVRTTYFKISKIHFLKILKIFEFFRTDFSKISNILDIPSPSAAGRLQKLDFHHFGEKITKLSKFAISPFVIVFYAPNLPLFQFLSKSDKNKNVQPTQRSAWVLSTLTEAHFKSISEAL